MDIGFVVHIHVFNVHRGSIAFRDHLKAGHDISQSSLCVQEVGCHSFSSYERRLFLQNRGVERYVSAGDVTFIESVRI